jgi:hypothetical protein
VFVGNRVLVLSDRVAGTEGGFLALPLPSVQALAQTTRLRAGPPAAVAVAGYGAWGDAILTVVDPALVGIAAAGAQPSYVALVRRPSPGEPDVVAMLVHGALGVHRLRRSPRMSPGDVAVLWGETPVGPIGVLDPTRLWEALELTGRGLAGAGATTSAEAGASSSDTTTPGKDPSPKRSKASAGRSRKKQSV